MSQFEWKHQHDELDVIFWFGSPPIVTVTWIMYYYDIGILKYGTWMGVVGVGDRELGCAIVGEMDGYGFLCIEYAFILARRSLRIIDACSFDSRKRNCVVTMV
ncbi:hypothetical protein BPOR_0372g00110 [Botrytis porri]|uniref:Transmembrane protein n=1 Tax=Botrytis porri TaxID=87229 RepID=A0A4Z1KI20_9HELO|nr:hypothetical protein BPOR_0372g00110 [Botrytis porri]